MVSLEPSLQVLRCIRLDIQDILPLERPRNEFILVYFSPSYMGDGGGKRGAAAYV